MYLLRDWISALTFWTSLLELGADLTGWHGLQWSATSLRGLVLTSLLRAGRHLQGSGCYGLIMLVLAFLPALALHLALASLRNWRLNPRHRLRPGRYPDRQISRLDIPIPGGSVPALHIRPRAGARAIVCYVHGSGSDKYFYTWNLADALVARGLALLLIDSDGHGESLQSQHFPGTLHNFSGVLHWLQDRYARVGVIGTSLGGCLATRAITEGAPADALVVLAAPPRLRLTRQQIFQEALRLLCWPVLRQLREGSPYHLVRAWTTTPLIRAHISTRNLIGALDLLGSLRRLARRQPASPPLLLVYAGRDAIVPREQAEQVRRARPEWATFHLLPGASHLSLTIDPRLLRLVSGWLYTTLAGDRDHSET